MTMAEREEGSSCGRRPCPHWQSRRPRHSVCRLSLLLGVFGDSTVRRVAASFSFPSMTNGGLQGHIQREDSSHANTGEDDSSLSSLLHFGNILAPGIDYFGGPAHLRQDDVSNDEHDNILPRSLVIPGHDGDYSCFDFVYEWDNDDNLDCDNETGVYILNPQIRPERCDDIDDFDEIWTDDYYDPCYLWEELYGVFSNLTDTSHNPTYRPSALPTVRPSGIPTVSPSDTPTVSPSDTPTGSPSDTPTVSPSDTPTTSPTAPPTASPTYPLTAMPSGRLSPPPFSPGVETTETPTPAPSPFTEVTTDSPSITPMPTPFAPVPTDSPTSGTDSVIRVAVSSHTIDLTFRQLRRVRRGRRSLLTINHKILVSVLTIHLNLYYVSLDWDIVGLSLEMTPEGQTGVDNSIVAKYTFWGEVEFGSDSNAPIGAADVDLATLAAFEGDAGQNFVAAVRDSDDSVLATVQSVSVYPTGGDDTSDALQTGNEDPDSGGGSSSNVAVIAGSVAAVATVCLFVFIILRHRRRSKHIGRERNLRRTLSPRSDGAPSEARNTRGGDKLFQEMTDESCSFSMPQRASVADDVSSVSGSALPSEYDFSVQYNSAYSLRTDNYSMDGASETGKQHEFRAPVPQPRKTYESDEESSIANMSALGDIRLNSVLQLDEDGGDVNSLAAGSTATHLKQLEFTDIWRGYKKKSSLSTDASLTRTSSTELGTSSQPAEAPARGQLTGAPDARHGTRSPEENASVALEILNDGKKDKRDSGSKLDDQKSDSILDADSFVERQLDQIDHRKSGLDGLHSETPTHMLDNTSDDEDIFVERQKSEVAGQAVATRD